MGSIERCLAILTEHFGGKWPFWLNPKQIAVIPVSSKFVDYSQFIKGKLKLLNYHVDIDDSNASINKRVRNA